MLVTIFTSVLAPLILVAGAAYLLGRMRRLDPTPLATATFYIFNPCLVFLSLATTAADPALLGRLALLKLLTYMVMIPISVGVAGRLKLTAPVRSAFLLSVLFANSGNFGLAVNEYAFGKDAIALAAISFITDNLMVNSLGVYIATRGRAQTRYALGQVFGNPALYAIPLGLMANQLHWALPLPLTRMLELGSRAAVPCMLVVLGLQLATLPLNCEHWRLAGLGSVLRLLLAPLVTLALIGPLGLSGAGRQVGLLQAAVPTAVSAGIVASRYDATPSLVAGTIFVSSLASLVTITLLLSWIL